jgi:hypothetical protein
VPALGRWEDHLSPGVQDQPSHYSETTSTTTKNGGNERIHMKKVFMESSTTTLCYKSPKTSLRRIKTGRVKKGR